MKIILDAKEVKHACERYVRDMSRHNPRYKVVAVVHWRGENAEVELIERIKEVNTGTDK